MYAIAVTEAAQPLVGLKVVAFEQAVAAPLCTRHLADLGADVVKIERRGDGDFARGYDTALNGTSTYWAWLNRRKRSLTLDLKQKGGVEVANRLVAGADVVVQNFAPGAMDRLGLGVTQLHERFPSLVVASITGYGEDGPYRDRKAYDMLVQAEAGVISITGTPEDPSKVGVSLVDLSAGIYAFSSIMAALYRRQATGEGAAIRISLFDTIMEWMSPHALVANYGTPQVRAGARHGTIVPYGQYAVGGGRHVMLAVQNEREWVRLCADVLKHPEWATDDRFNTNVKRLANRDVLERMIEEALADVSVEEAEARLEAAAIAYSRLNDAGEVLSHPQIVERNRLIDVSVPGATFPLLRSPFNIEGLDEGPASAPGIGEHTDEVLAELGFSRAEIAALKSEEAV